MKKPWRIENTWTPEQRERFMADAPLHSDREMADIYNLSSASLANALRKRLGTAPITSEARKRIVAKVERKAAEGKARMTRQQVEKAIRKSTEANRALRITERRRVIFGLPQRTKLRISLNSDKSRKRIMAKSRMVKRNGYVGENGSRVLYYDAHTRRSAYMERRNSEIYGFVFKPAEGFNEADSQYIIDKVWNVKN